MLSAGFVNAPAPRLPQNRRGRPFGGLVDPGAWVAFGPMGGLDRNTGVLSRQISTTIGFLQHPDTQLFTDARNASRRGARLMPDRNYAAVHFDSADLAHRLVSAWNMFTPPMFNGVTACVVDEPPYSSTTCPIDPLAFYTISVRSWNIHNHLPEYTQMLDSRLAWEDYDIHLFQETGLIPGQEHSLLIPDGYKIIAYSRAVDNAQHKHIGGVAAVYRKALFPNLKILNAYCDSEMMVIDLGFVCLINAYVAPVGSPWWERSHSAPFAKVSEAMVYCRETDRAVMLIGDLNARTGSRQGFDGAPTRRSSDAVRGEHMSDLLTLADAAELTIVNGLEGFSATSGGITSFNHETSDDRGAAVVDYVVACPAALPLVLDHHVLHRRGASDHAPSLLQFVARGSQLSPLRPVPRPRKRTQKDAMPQLPRDTLLDRKLADLVHAALKATPATRLRDLYGTTSGSFTKQSIAYTDGSCHDNGKSSARAGAGVFYGEGSKYNIARRVPDAQTNNRAEIYAIYLVVSSHKLDRALVIRSDSKWAIASLTWWAANRAAAGWNGKHGDILRECARWLRARTAPTHFDHVLGHAGDPHNEGADREANSAALLEAVGTFVPRDIPPTPPLPADAGGIQHPKVTTSMADPGADADDRRSGKQAQWLSDKGHHGRTKKAHRQHQKRDLLLDSRHHGSAWWSAYKHLHDPKKLACKIPASELQPVFKERMNPPAVPPSSFHAGAAAAAHAHASNIDAVPQTAPPNDNFRRDFTIEDIENLKAKIGESSKRGSPGLDGVTRALIKNMDNDALLELFNLCIQLKSAPSIWLRTVIIGILKRNLPEEDAKSYRTIGLESVLLKLLTLLVHLRLYAWAEDNSIIPASQNGFRTGYRTNNNAVILRTIIEKYRDLDQPVFVAFVDISNAFPSTNRDMLWVELHKRGCAGPIIDWLRSLYENMRYIVRSGGDVSEEFESSVGVLIGDPSSPTLWNLFLADFDPPAHPDDPMLGDTRVHHLEHADDGALISLSAHGLQSKLDYLYNYAGIKQLLTNAIKTHCMIFNPLPARPLTLYLGNTALTYVMKVTYVGVTFSSNHRNVCRLHYDETKRRANSASWAITGAEAVLKDLPPAIARLLYTARLDPILCSAADIVPDADECVAKLEKIQIAFLQRTLGLSGHCMHTPLFTELNLMPLRYRRAVLALRFLRYALEQPPGTLVRAAIEEALLMYDAVVSGWIGDLANALQKLPHPVTLPEAAAIRLPNAVDAIIADVQKALRAELLADIKSSPRLYLMYNRLEPQKRGPPKKTLMQFRHYLRLRSKEDRKAFTRLIASEHPFAIEKLRHAHNRNYKQYKTVDRDKRLCRLCASAVESPEHALLLCKGNDDLIDMRKAFIEKVLERVPTFHVPAGAREALTALKQLLASPDTVVQMAEFTRKVFEIFSSVELVWPAEFVADVPRRNRTQ